MHDPDGLARCDALAQAARASAFNQAADIPSLTRCRGSANRSLAPPVTTATRGNTVDVLHAGRFNGVVLSTERAAMLLSNVTAAFRAGPAVHRRAVPAKSTRVQNVPLKTDAV